METSTNYAEETSRLIHVTNLDIFLRLNFEHFLVKSISTFRTPVPPLAVYFPNRPNRQLRKNIMLGPVVQQFAGFLKLSACSILRQRGGIIYGAPSREANNNGTKDIKPRQKLTHQTTNQIQAPRICFTSCCVASACCCTAPTFVAIQIIPLAKRKFYGVRRRAI